MLRSSRASAKNALLLLQRRVSSSKHSLKQTKDTSECVGSQPTIELPPGAKATNAAMPKPPPASSSTGASSYAAGASSSFSSRKGFSSIPLYVRYALLGSGALGAGAMLYSLSGSEDENNDWEYPADLEAGRPFFNRLAEQKEFTRAFADDPGGITVLLGPHDCGISRFVHKMALQFKEDKTAPPFMVIDNRLTSMATPDKASLLLSYVLKARKVKQSKKNKDKDLDILSQLMNSLRYSIGKLSIIPEGGQSTASERDKFEIALENAMESSRAFDSLPRKPVLVIDEANILMDWRENDPSQKKLRKLLQFLVEISKQQNLVHVVLAASDWFLVNWLVEKGVSPDAFKVRVIGNLSENEARDYFFGDAEGTWPGIINNRPCKAAKVPDGAEQHWSEIYKWCGGNFLDLNHCVSSASLHGDWKIGLEHVERRIRSKVKDGFSPSNEWHWRCNISPIWTPDQWKMVLECITTAPHYAVLKGKLEPQLEAKVTKMQKSSGADGKAILLSMKRHRLLAVRPPSSLARDLPQEVYGPSQEEVVTFPSPGHVWAAKELLAHMQAEEKEAKKTSGWLKMFRFSF